MCLVTVKLEHITSKRHSKDWTSMGQKRGSCKPRLAGSNMVESMRPMMKGV